MSGPKQPSPDARQLAAAVIGAMERIQDSRYRGATDYDAAYALGRVLGILDGLMRGYVPSVDSVIERLDAITVTHHDPEDDPEGDVSG